MASFDNLYFEYQENFCYKNWVADFIKKDQVTVKNICNEKNINMDKIHLLHHF